MFPGSKCYLFSHRLYSYWLLHDCAIGCPFDTVHPESIHSASLFLHLVMLQPYSKMDYLYFLPQNSTHNTP